MSDAAGSSAVHQGCLREVLQRQRAPLFRAGDEPASGPHAAQRSGMVLTSLGTILLHNRTLTHTDSQTLRGLYDQVRNTEALASWMLVEYESRKAATSTAFVDDAAAYVTFNDAEAGSLPPMIPDDAVIDVGKTPAADTTGKRMWLPASPNDQAWFPGYGKVPASTSVNNAIGALNASGGFKNWQVPTKAQFVQLTQDCTNTPCSGSNLKPGTTIQDYLRGLDEGSSLWQGLFCNQSNPKITCLAEPPAHRFIWVSDLSSQHMECGYTLGYLFIHIVASRTYPEHTGIVLSSRIPSSAAEAVPQLPSQVPGYTLQNDNVSHDLCDNYTTPQVQLPKNKGIVLATRSTEPAQIQADSTPPHDLNPTTCVDYMDQKLPTPCVK